MKCLFIILLYIKLIFDNKVIMADVFTLSKRAKRLPNKDSIDLENDWFLVAKPAIEEEKEEEWVENDLFLVAKPATEEEKEKKWAVNAIGKLFLNIVQNVIGVRNQQPRTADVSLDEVNPEILDVLRL